MSIPSFILDKRVVHRNIAKGALTREDLAKNLASLPDMEGNMEICTPDGPMKAEEESTDEAE